MPPPTPTQKTIIIGLSGPSSSGKTTLARLLRSIFNLSFSFHEITLFILHEDDFYLPDQSIPVVTVSSAEHGIRELQDWDCVESLDLGLFEKTLRHIQNFGGLPPDMFSKEDRNEVGESGVGEDVVRRYHDEVREWLDDGRGSKHESNTTVDKEGRKHITICILDGFLLYPRPSGHGSTSTSTSTASLSFLAPLLSLSLFLPSTRAQTLTRRARRSGYVTLEGFWSDPPGYVEDVVWPNYAREHGWMFMTEKDVDEGRVDRDKVEREGSGMRVGPLWSGSARNGRQESGKGDGYAGTAAVEGNERVESANGVDSDREEKVEVTMAEVLDWAVHQIRRELEGIFAGP